MKLRIKSYRDKSGWEGYQKLQEKKWYGWVTIDREEIPNYVIIYQGCYGDTGGWKSKWAHHWNVPHFPGKFGDPIDTNKLYHPGV